MPIYREMHRAAENEDSEPIPYPALASDIYARDRQLIVPFLGAGASLQMPVNRPPAEVATSSIQRDQMRRICKEEFGIVDEEACVVMKLALSVALEMQSSANARAQGQQLMSNRVKESPFPPSASELAEAFAEQSSYNYFESILQRAGRLTFPGLDRTQLVSVLRSFCDLTGIANTSPSLLEASSYFEYKLKRETLRRFLIDVFNDKKSTPTVTHELVAEVAGNYLGANADNDEASDYLIVTSNYDGLMEIALDRAKLPYYVLTVRLNESPVVVDVRFTNSVQSYLGYTAERYQRFLQNIRVVPPREFSAVGRRVKPLVALFKIHGDLYPPGASERPDTIVISDDDYVRFFHNDAQIGMLPAFIQELMQKKTLLLLGYRFSDWNVRSFYNTIAEKRIPGKQADWAVLMKISRYERGYFETRQINVAETTLAEFAAGVRGNGPSRGGAATP
jgi:hypothetical protein